MYDARNTLGLRAFQDLSFQIRKVQPVFSGRMHFGCTCPEEGCVAVLMASVTGVEKCLATSGYVSGEVSRETKQGGIHPECGQ